ncbi:MAG: SPOR domain-containing protein [Nitrospirae bacterium]|nr:SPOR domain-containing protein [Nitrospirota bacterium]
MRLRGPERSSILLLGRNTVVIGAVVIIIVGFGLGYFFGYKGGDFLQSGKEDDRTANEKAAAISDEKKALDAAPADKPVIPPPIMPPEIPQENKAQKPLLTDADKSKEAPKDLPTAKERKADKPPVFPPEPPKEKEPAQTEQASGEQTADKPQPAEADAKAKSGKSVKKTIKNKGSQKISKPSPGKLYTVQFGAFPSREGAEQLQAALKSKGIKAYIVEKSEGDPYFRVRAGAFKSKKEAGSAAVSMQKKTSIQNFVATK